MTSSPPLVSVLMVVQNDQEYINIAIDSILRQSYKSLELIIVLLPSSDSTKSIIAHYRDERIRLLTASTENYFEALNLGVVEARGKFIARMGPADISHPDRLQVMVDYLEKHSEAGLVNSSIEYINQDSKVYAQSFDLNRSTDLRLNLLVGLPFPPTVPILRSALYKDIGIYDPRKKNSEHDFYWRAATKYQFGIVDRPLYATRVKNLAYYPLKNGWGNVRLTSKSDIQQAIQHYNKLDSVHNPEKHFYRDQYVYLLASLIRNARKKGHYFSAIYLAWSALSAPGIRHSLKDALRNPSPYNHSPYKERLE